MLEQLKELMAEALNLKEEEIVPTANLRDDLGIDSLDAVELIMELEDTFEISIDDEEAQKFTTIADILATLEQKVG